MKIEEQTTLSRKQVILFLGALGVIAVVLSCLGSLSEIGFRSVVYLGESPRLNMVIAYFLVFCGMGSVCYLHLRHAVWSASLAIWTYLLSAIAMGGVYYLVYRSHYGCFALPPDMQTQASTIDFVYFSLVTVSTVGFGDIVPRHGFVRLLVVGQILLALYLVVCCLPRMWGRTETTESRATSEK